MRNRILWPSVICALVAVLCFSAFAEETMWGETMWGGRLWRYYPSDNYWDGHQVFLDDAYAEGFVDIPDYIDGLPVADVMYAGCTHCVDYLDSPIKYVTSVRIPETVKRIGVQAFGGQIYLRNVVLPASLEIIGTAAFQDCPGPFSFKGDQPDVEFPSGESRTGAWATPFGSAAQAANVTVYFVDGRAGWVNNGRWYGATTKRYPGTELVSGVRATQGTYQGRVRVSWNAVPGNEKGYDVYRTYTDILTGAYQLIGSVGRYVTSFDDTTAGAHRCVYLVVPAGYAKLIGVENPTAVSIPFNTAQGWAAAPVGHQNRPEVIPGWLNDADYRASAVRTLIGAADGESYWFRVEAKPGIRYSLSAAGRSGLSISVPGVDCDESVALDRYARVVFHVDSNLTVGICVSASETGDFSAEAHWTDLYHPERVYGRMAAALGSPTGELTAGGDGEWTIDGWSLRSGLIGDDMSSWLELAVDGDGRLEFDCKVSSEESYDKLSCSVDGDYLGEISGEKEWIHVAWTVSGQWRHVIRWVYSKDSSASCGQDSGWLRNVKWSPIWPHAIRFDPNGGECDFAEAIVMDGAEVGDSLPSASRNGFIFLGWYTSRYGGALVTPATRMVGYDVTLYAHWEKIASGSCIELALPFSMTPTVRSYGVSLVREWTGDGYCNGCNVDGVLYCSSTLQCGRIYTMAVPRGVYFDAWCEDSCVSISRGEDDTLSYCRIDTRSMCYDEAKLIFVAYGAVGMRTTIYAVEMDYPASGSCESRAIVVAPRYSVCLDSGELHPSWNDSGYDYAGVRYYKVTLNRGDVCTFAFPAASGWDFYSRYQGDEADIFRYVESETLDYVLVDLRNADLRAPGSGDRHLPLDIWIRISGECGSLGGFYHCRGNLLPKQMRRLEFHPTGGDVEFEVKLVRYGDRVGQLPWAARAGYSFAGWYTSAEGGTRVYESTVMVDYNVVLYARWTPLRYTIRFVSRGQVVSTRSVTFGLPIGWVPTPAAPWDSTYGAYWIFDGWHYGDYGPVTEETVMTVPGDITLEAWWLVPNDCWECQDW